MDEWYRTKAFKTFEESLDKQYPLVQKYGIQRPEIERWESALIESNTILLNSELIKAPKNCIDYVVLHELIHFRYNDHKDSFYSMLYSLMPEWEKRKAMLDDEIVREI